MKYKKSMIILVLLIFIFAAASVCASDVNDTVITSEDDSAVELPQADPNEITDENELIGQTDNELISEENSGTFAELKAYIDAAGSTLTLNKSYKCEDGFDSEGILINKSITIDGNGFKIDTQGKSRIFKITAENVVLKNIIFTNAEYDGYGGAVNFNKFGTVINCTFTDNKAIGSSSGGAIYFSGSGEVKNCNFTNNYAGINGGAVYFSDSGEVTNCTFTNNYAHIGNGGAIYLGSGEVKNCNFTNNTVRYYGGAIYFNWKGELTDCIFTNNKAIPSSGDGGAVYFSGSGEVKNCNFTNNNAYNKGGAIWMPSGSVENCNFTNHTAYYDGGAVYFSNSGKVTNCTFTGNTLFEGNGGAVYFSYSGEVTNCTFTNNYAYSEGGAVYFSGSGEATNCTFTNNSANYGGAICFQNGKVTNCYFADNRATTEGGAISYGGTADTCIFKTTSDTTEIDTVILSPTLNVDNFTTFYGSIEKVTFDLRTNISSIPVTNGKISISVYFKDNDSWVRNFSCLSGEGWIPDLPAGSYYAIFDTEYAEFKQVNRTITITIPEIQYHINVTSLTTNNKTVNITAKSDIPKDILWDGKLLFILPNGKNITADYAGNGTWWAVHEFDEYGVYQVNATYVGLDNLSISNGTVNITRADSTITLNDIVLTYGESIEVTVATEGATSITAKIDNNDVTVTNKFTIPISGLNAGNYTLTVITIPDRDHNSVTKSVNLTVNKATAEIIINQDTFVLNATDVVGGSIAYLEPDVGNLTYASSNEDVVIVKDNEFIAVGAGKANITVSFTGNENYAPSMNKTVEFSVNAIPTSISVDKTEFVLLVGDEANIIETVTPEGIAVKYATDDDNIVSVDDKGHIKAVGEGTAIILVSVGDDRVYKYSAVEVSVKVSKIPTQITSSALTTVYNANKKLIVTLKDNKGNPISGVSITVNLKGAKTYKTDKNGQIKISTKGLAPKKYTAKITFNGDKNYAKSAKNVKVTVKKAKPKITAKKKVTYKAKAKTKKLKITLKDSNGKPIKNAKVRLMLKKIGKGGKKNTKAKANKKIAKTNKKGKATFKIKKNKKAKYQAYVKFYANKYYKKTIKELKITIK